MALAGGQVHDAAAGQQVQPPVAEVVLLDQRQHLAHAAAGQLAQRRRGRSPRRSGRRWPARRRRFIRSKCSRRSTAREPVTVTNRSPRSAASSAGITSNASMRASSARSGSTSQTITVRPGAAGALGDPLAGGAVAEQHQRAAGQQQVGGAQDAVERRLAGAVAVVEGALGARLVHRDHRAGEPALRLEPAQAQQPGGGLLRPAR